MNHWYKKRKTEQEIALGAYNKQNIHSNARNVESMAINLAISYALKIKMTKMKIIRKQKDVNIKIKNSMKCATIAVRREI